MIAPGSASTTGAETSFRFDLHAATYRGAAVLWLIVALLWMAALPLAFWRAAPGDPLGAVVVLRVALVLALVGAVVAARRSYDEVIFRAAAPLALALLAVNLVAPTIVWPDQPGRTSELLMAHLVLLGLSLGSLGRPVSAAMVLLCVTHAGARSWAGAADPRILAVETLISFGVLAGMVVLVEHRARLERATLALGLVSRLRQEEVRRTSEDLEQFLGLSIDLLGIATVDGRFVKLSRAWEELLGYPPGALEGKAFLPLVHPDDVEATSDALRRLGEGHRVLGFVNRYRHADGSWRSIEWRSGIARDSGLVYFAARDVTERLALVDELTFHLRQSEEVAELSGIGGWYVDMATMTPHWDRMTRRIHEVDDAYEPDMDSAIAFYAPEGRPVIQEAVAHSRRTGEGWDLELPFVTARGRRIWVRAVGRAILREGGAVAALVGAFQDITDRKERERGLEAARTEAEASRDAASRFLANMSHEIRTPMTGVLGLLDMVLEGELAAGQREHLQDARQSAENLLSILNDVLDFSRIEAEGVTLHPAPCEVGSLCEQVLALFRPAAQRRSVALRLEADERVPGSVLIDPSRLCQLLVNLVGNAVKFTEAGSVIVRTGWIGAASEDGIGRLRISVRDTGIGIAPEARARLFRRFSQADAGTTRRFGGTGLGLAISKQVVDAMDGAIGCDSVEGQGSTFWFELPCEAAGVAPRLPKVSAPPLGGPVCRILVADDTSVNRTIVRAFLQRDGHDVTVVSDGAQALRALTDRAYDLVLMDVRMPVMDGIEATKALRASGGTRAATPVVALTADVLPGDRERFLEAGMDAYLPKPVDRSALRTVVARFAPKALAAAHP